MNEKIRVNDYQRLVEELIGEMALLDAEHYSFQTDLYLYIKEDGSWRLEEFENVGGRSWLEDDHILIYQDRPHYEDVQDWETDDVQEIAKELLHLYGDEYREKAWNALDEADIIG